MRVLLIEDDSAVAQSIELMLKSESFNVYTTDLGEEGVDLGKLYDYDIILLDLNLPDMSGYDVLKQLRVSKIKTPILILSGLAGIEDKVKGLGVGADDYMTKPFHKDELVARIHAIVRRSKGHAQSVIPTGDLVVNLDTKTVEVGPREVEMVERRGPLRCRRPELAGTAVVAGALDGGRVDPLSCRRRITGRGDCTAPFHSHRQAVGKRRVRRPAGTIHLAPARSAQKRPPPKTRS